MNDLIEKENIKIENMIYEIRGKQVMLDSDVAKIFDYETKQLNRQVSRNKERFPDSFCFQLTETEYKNLRCQNVTSSLENNYGGRRYLPYVFTEYGITMLAGILKSKIAVEVSIKIVNAFVAMRKYLTSTNYEKRINTLETKVLEHDMRFDEIFERLEPKVNNHLFYEGQIYDAYSLLIDILNSAKESIIIIDNYIDKKFLDIIFHVKVDITLITSNKCNLTNTDISKYNSEYHNLEIKYNNNFNDRFIIIDNSILYHCGASLKDLGKKCFAINKIEETELLNKLKSKLFT